MNWRRLGWSLLTLILLGVNVVAFRESWRLQNEPISGFGRGPFEAYETTVFYADGRGITTVTDVPTGVVISRTLIRPARDWAQVEACWPVVASVLFSTSVVWFIRRNAASRLLRVIRLNPPTFAGMMILVAIFAVECSMITAWLGSVRANLDRVDWPGLMLIVLGLNVLALVPIGVFLTYVEESDPTKKGQSLTPSRWVFLESSRRRWPISRKKPRAWPELDGLTDRGRRP